MSEVLDHEAAAGLVCPNGCSGDFGWTWWEDVCAMGEVTITPEGIVTVGELEFEWGVDRGPGVFSCNECRGDLDESDVDYEYS